MEAVKNARRCGPDPKSFKLAPLRELHHVPISIKHTHSPLRHPLHSSELLSTVTGGVGATKKGDLLGETELHDRDVAVNQSPQHFGADVE